jgi:integrase
LAEVRLFGFKKVVSFSAETGEYQGNAAHGPGRLETTMRLTQRAIERANKRRKYSDGRGLFLSVSKNGRKTWAFCYTHNGRSREMGLGSVDFLSLDEARDKAVELRKLLRSGVDPLSERQAEERLIVRRKRTGSTFKEVAERLIDKKKPEWSDTGKSEQSWRGSLENHAYPKIGDMDVADIDVGDLRDLLHDLLLTRTETARRLRKRVEEILDFAAAEGLRPDDNPARKGKLDQLLPKASKLQKVKQHAAMPYQELPGFMVDLRAENGIAPRALEFLILTAARTSEVIEAPWSEIDLEAGVWMIPAERMKMDRPHRVPLTPPAIALLRSLPREEDNPFVFISPMLKGQPMSNMAMTNVLKRMKRKDGVTVHGFRSTFRDWASEETAYPGPVAEMALAHTIESKVEAAYRRGDLFEKRKPLMADWAAYCAGPKEGKVIPIRQAAQ